MSLCIELQLISFHHIFPLYMYTVSNQIYGIPKLRQNKFENVRILPEYLKITLSLTSYIYILKFKIPSKKYIFSQNWHYHLHQCE